MKPEKPPFVSNSPNSDYEQRLIETREKCLPLLERLTGKFTEYKQLSAVLKEGRPSVKWLNKLELTCEKIQKKMTAQFFEKLVEAESKNRNNTVTTSGKADIEKVGVKNQEENYMSTPKRSRWDVKPINERKHENISTKKQIPIDNDRDVNKNNPVPGKRHSNEKRLAFIDLTQNEDAEEILCKQEIPKSKSKKNNHQDMDVEIIASTAGLNPLRRVKSQTQFVTLEEVNKSPFYKKFTSDNMTLDSRAANLKYGTVIDLIKSKAQTSETRHRKNPHRRYEGFSRKPLESNEPWSHRQDYENKKYHLDSFNKKVSLSYNKSQVTNSASNKTYDNEKIAVNVFNQNNESKVSSNPRWSNDTSSSKKYGKTGNEFQGKMPFYKQNCIENYRYPYSEKSLTNQPSKYRVSNPPPNLCSISNKSVPSCQNLRNGQFNSSEFPPEACSFHCSCCKNTSYFSSMGALYQPTSTSVNGNNNYAFLQYFQNQPVIPSTNTNLPTPFPTYAVPPLSTAALAASNPPYNFNTNKPGYSVPVFCNEGNTTTNKTAPSLIPWNTSNIHNMELTCTEENTKRPKDPRAESIKDGLIQSTLNTTQKYNALNSTLTKNPCSSGIPEERFSQSCTFLRPDNLYRDFKCHSNDFRNNSFESLKSFGLIKNVTNESATNKVEILSKSIGTEKNFPSSELTFKINRSERNNFTESSHNLQTAYQTDNHEGSVNILLDNKMLNPHENYTSPLSNLYNDYNAGMKGYSNEINQHLETKKRKCDVLGGHFFGGDYKRKNVGKVEPMTKSCDVITKESLTAMSNTNFDKPSSLKNREIRMCSELNILQKGKDASLSSEHCQKIKSLTELVDKDYKTKPHEISTNENPHKPKESSHTIVPISESKLVSSKENIVIKDKLLETAESFRKLKEQNYKPYNTLNKQPKLSKKLHVPGKQKPAEKDKMLQNMSTSSKLASEKIEPSRSPVVQVQSHEKTTTSQKEISDCKKQTSSSKNTDKRLEQNANPSVELLLSKSIPVSQKVNQVDKDKFSEDKTASNRPGSDKKKCFRSQKNKIDKSTEKETCLKETGSFNKPVISKNPNSVKMSNLPDQKILNTKDLSSEKVSLVTNKAKDIQKTATDQTGNSENPMSVFSKNKDKNKITIPRKGKTREEKPVKHRSKKLTVINSTGSQSKLITPKENSVKKSKIVDKSSTNQNTNAKLNTANQILPLRIASDPNEKCSKRKMSSGKQSDSKIKDCSVVLHKEKLIVAEKCSNKNFNVENPTSKHIADNVAVPEKAKSYDMGICPEKKSDSKMCVSNNFKCTKNTKISLRERTDEKITNNVEEKSNSDNDKVKDLILRMKSLSQSEALKVITEFASTLKVDETQEDSVQHTNVPKIVLTDQRFPPKEKEIDITTSDIKIKYEFQDDYSEPVEAENRDCIEIGNIESADKTVETTVNNTISIKTVQSQSIKKQLVQTFEVKENKVEPTLQEGCANMTNAIIIDIKNCHNSLGTVTEITPEKQCTNLIAANTNHNLQTEKSKCNKKKKLSELDKIYADLESCHGLDDIMKCSGFRTCRLKNESIGTYKENASEEKPIKKRRVAVSPEESFFIEDEITIKMEPIPELTFDFIKQEPYDFE